MKTLMIVDDDERVIDSLRQLFRSPEYMVIASQDGRSALDVVCSGVKIDLVITDYQMPQMNGLELLAALKERAPDIPVVMITTFARSDLYLQALALGVAEFLEKTAIPRELRRITESLLLDTSSVSVSH